MRISDNGISFKHKYLALPVDKSLYSDRQAKLLHLLREIRTEAGLRQVDLAEKLGEPQSFVSKYERGERRLDVIELEQVCDCCGVTLGAFVARLRKGR